MENSGKSAHMVETTIEIEFKPNWWINSWIGSICQSGSATRSAHLTIKFEYYANELGFLIFF